MITPVPVPYAATYQGFGCVVLAWCFNNNTITMLIAVAQSGAIKQATLDEVMIDGQRLWAAATRAAQQLPGVR